MKNIYLKIVLVFLMFGKIYSQGDTQLFRFRTGSTENNIFYTFYHNLDTNEAEIRPVLNEDFKIENGGYLEALIIKPTEDVGKVLIASAKAPNFFLKRKSNEYDGSDLTVRSGDDIRRIEFGEIEEGTDLSLYTWHIELASVRKVYHANFVRIKSSEKEVTLTLDRRVSNKVILTPVRRVRFLRGREQGFFKETLKNVF